MQQMEQVLAQKHLHVLEGQTEKSHSPLRRKNCPNNISHHMQPNENERIEPTSDAVARTDLDDKYHELLAKINKQTRVADVGAQGADGDDDENEANLEDPANGSNDQLKRLYDASVTFKNDLANLRGNIKSLNAKTNSYSSKCDDFHNELDQLFQMNKTMQE